MQLSSELGALLVKVITIIRCVRLTGYSHRGPDLIHRPSLLTLIHPGSAWKGYSVKFAKKVSR
jgi:hypothetical protein